MFTWIGTPGSRMSGYWQGARRQWWWWRQGRWRSEHIGVVRVRRGLQGRGKAVRGALVRRQGQGEGGGCCGRRWRRWVREVQGGSRRPVGFGAWGAAPAAAVERDRKKEEIQREEPGQSRHDQSELTVVSPQPLISICSNIQFPAQCFHTLTVLHLQTPPCFSLVLHRIQSKHDPRKHHICNTLRCK